MSQTESQAWRKNMLLLDELSLEIAAFFVRICLVIFQRKTYLIDSYYTTSKMKNTI